jgi:hypothetical protein
VEEPLELEPPERPVRPRRPQPRRRRRTWVRWLVRTCLVAILFLLGLVVGRALEDAPKPGGSQTIVQTLQPSTLRPVQTVVVTVTAP